MLFLHVLMLWRYIKLLTIFASKKLVVYYCLFCSFNCYEDKDFPAFSYLFDMPQGLCPGKYYVHSLPYEMVVLVEVHVRLEVA